MKIIIEADLSPWETAQIIQNVRELDRPWRTILLAIDAPEFSLAQQMAVFDFLKPPMEIVGLFRKYFEEI
jgi:hypothetical protein